MSALQTLRSIGQNMETTQDRVSSGQRVGEASDNAAYWSIATTMRSDNGALSAVQDALGLGAAKVDTAYSGMESSIDVVKEIKNKLVAAREPGVDKSKIQEEISQLQDQLKSISSSSSFSGENWLQATISNGAGELKNVTKQIVGSFIRDAAGNVSVKTVNVDLSRNTVLFDTSSGAAKDKQGVLDSYAYFSSTGSYKLFEITNDSDGAGAAQPVTKVAAAKVYTEAQLKGLKEATAGTAVTFTTAAATGIVTIANADTTVPNVNGTYFNLGNDQYVKINTTAPTAPATKTSIAVGLDGTTKIYLEEGADAQLATQLTYSLTSLDITKDLTGTFKNSDGSAVSENQYLDA
ncbi:flagellar hook associated protein, partial [Agrobacterium pusense]